MGIARKITHLNIFISWELPLLEACKFQQIWQEKKSHKNSSILWSNSTPEVVHFQIPSISNSLLSQKTTVTNLADFSIGPNRANAPEVSISYRLK